MISRNEVTSPRISRASNAEGHNLEAGEKFLCGQAREDNGVQGGKIITYSIQNNVPGIPVGPHIQDQYIVTMMIFFTPCNISSGAPSNIRHSCYESLGAVLTSPPFLPWWSWVSGFTSSFLPTWEFFHETLHQTYFW